MSHQILGNLEEPNIDIFGDLEHNIQFRRGWQWGKWRGEVDEGYDEHNYEKMVYHCQQQNRQKINKLRALLTNNY